MLKPNRPTILLLAGALSVHPAFSAETARPGTTGAPSDRRNPAQVFQFLDKDRNNTLSEAEFAALKERMSSSRQRPEALGAMFKRLVKDGSGSLTLEEYQAMATEGPLRPGATPAPAPQSTPPPPAAPSSPTPAVAAPRLPMPSPSSTAPAKSQDTAKQPLAVEHAAKNQRQAAM